MNIQVTFAGLEPLIAAVDRLTAALGGTNTIAYLDRPDVGGPPQPHVPNMPLALLPAAPSTAEALPAFAAGFTPPGGAAVQIPPPPVPPAPSTAAAATGATVPAVPPASSPVPPSVPVPPAPSPASSAAAPSAPATPTSPAGAAAYDRSGLPWDPRIHASNKSTNKDGTWRRKRDTADAFFDQVVAELRAAVAAQQGATQQAAVPPAPPPAMVTLAGATMGLPASMQPPVVVPPALAASAAVPPALAAAAAGAISFGEFVVKVEPYILAGKLTMDALTQALQHHDKNLTTINQLMHAPALVPLVDSTVSMMLGIAPGKAAA